MEKRIRKIIQTAKYSDESWEDVLVRINRDGGVDVKSIFRLMGVVLDEIESLKENGKEKSKK